jgi:hypothetical protein
MAHGITSVDGLVLAGERAWHGLGIVLPARCSPQEALKHAKMDWKVESAPVTAHLSDGREIKPSDHRLVVRSDTGEAFAAVSAKYRAIQNSELADLADMISKGSECCVETAGSILGGRKVWFMLDAGEVAAAADDKSRAYFFIGSSHDGSMPVTLGATATRVVCANTMGICLEGLGEDAMQFRHTRTAGNRIAAAGELLANARVKLDDYRVAVRRMAETPMDNEQVKAFFTSVWQRVNGKLTVRPVGQPASRRENRFIEEVAGWVDNFRNHKFQTSLSTSGTVWAALNSVTQWVNHDRTVREEVKDASRRTDAVLFGSGADVSRTAYNAAVELVMS